MSLMDQLRRHRVGLQSPDGPGGANALEQRDVLADRRDVDVCHARSLGDGDCRRS